MTDERSVVTDAKPDVYEGVRIFLLTPVNGKGKFHITLGDKSYGERKSFGAIMGEVAQDMPIDTRISYRLSTSKHPSFLPATVEDWLIWSAATRGVAKPDVAAEIEAYRNRGTW